VATRLILIVDDEAPLRDFLRIVLEDLGHRVVGAINGLHALTLAAAEPPDLVISDVMMPLMGGVELTRRLKAGEAGDAAVPVILMSAAGPWTTQTAGADAYIDKPFDLGSIEALVARWLS
jgi:two-component system, OmpR family, phosphate regulon response regulator PhoB